MICSIPVKALLVSALCLCGLIQLASAACGADATFSVRQRWGAEPSLYALNDIVLVNTGSCSITSLGFQFTQETSESIDQSWNLDVASGQSSATVRGFGGSLTPGQTFSGSGYIVRYDSAVDGDIHPSLINVLCDCPEPSSSSSPSSESTEEPPERTCQEAIILINNVQNKQDTNGNSYIYNHGLITNTADKDIAQVSVVINGVQPWDLAQLTYSGGINVYYLNWSSTPGVAILARTTASYSFNSRTVPTVALNGCSYVSESSDSSGSSVPNSSDAPSSSDASASVGECGDVSVTQQLANQWQSGENYYSQWDVTVTNSASVTLSAVSLASDDAGAITQIWSTSSLKANTYGFPSWITSLAPQGVWRFGYIVSSSSQVSFTVDEVLC